MWWNISSLIKCQTSYKENLNMTRPFYLKVSKDAWDICKILFRPLFILMFILYRLFDFVYVDTRIALDDHTKE